MIHIVLTVCRGWNGSLYSAVFGPPSPCGSSIWQFSAASPGLALLWWESWWSVSLVTPPCMEPSRRKFQADAAVPGTTEGDPGETYTPALFYDRICSGGGALSDRDRSFYHQIRSLSRWSNYRYCRQRGTGRGDPSGIVWQSPIRLYLHLHIVGNSRSLSSCIKRGLEEFRSSSPLNLIYLLLYWDVFYFLDEPFSRMDALVLPVYFGIYDIWGLRGLSEILPLTFFIHYGFLGFDNAV